MKIGDYISNLKLGWNKGLETPHNVKESKLNWIDWQFYLYIHRSHVNQTSFV